FGPGAKPAIVRADVVPLELAVSPSRYIGAAARATPRGRYPRHLLGEQAYWAVVTADGDDRKALLSEDGALEVDAESFTLEPFLWTGDRLLTWADGTSEVALADGHLPVPRVQRAVDDLRLEVAAAASGAAGASLLVARYTVTNTGGAPRRLRLFVAVRPFQVTPSWQSLNLVGGVAPLTRLAVDGATMRVNDARTVVAITPPAAAGVARSAEATPERAGEWRQGLSALGSGALPHDVSVDDPIGFAEGTFAFDLTLAPGAVETVVVAMPLHDAAPLPAVAADRAAAAAWGNRHIEQFTAHWRARLADLPIELPAAAAPFDTSLRASLGWILANREGPRIQPGSRCYRRSWIRDGALTGTALTEMGFADEARAFLRWYAPFQFADGRVPCAVDHRGIDLAIEHDSHGELAWGVVEVARLTGDVAFLRQLWPHVRGAVDAIAALRATRTGDAFRDDPRYGLLPESISHEGYASHPVHSYWDDFFAVLGLAHAADAAALLGEDADARRIAALRDAMRADLHASIARVLASQQLDFIPGSVELGDFDPTSTAIAFDPCGEYERLPPAALAHTFERYWAEFDARRRGDKPADAYTAYEVRTAAAFVMLGQRGRAVEQLAWLIADQRPAAWHQWPEVTWRDARAPRFIGDLPHGWIASSFVRTVRRMLAYERPGGRALVLAAGVPAEWVHSAPGVRVRRLPTHFGALDFAMCADGDDRVRVSLGGALRCPPDGVEIVSPFDRPLRAVEIDGRSGAPTDPSRVVVTNLPAEIVLHY
ncbi:MAG: discoidin domain-containing protein, partial [Candidatus Binatia bacterium]